MNRESTRRARIVGKYLRDYWWGRYKLFPDEIREIRMMRSVGYTLQEVGDYFGVTDRNILYICTYSTWRHQR